MLWLALIMVSVLGLYGSVDLWSVANRYRSAFDRNPTATVEAVYAAVCTRSDQSRDARLLWYGYRAWRVVGGADICDMEMSR
jgi:hypothetical protein